MKNLLAILLLFVGDISCFCQKEGNLEVSTAFGYVLQDNANGTMIDGEAGYFITPKISAGIYFNKISNSEEIEPLPELSLVLIDRDYLETISDFYTQNAVENATSIGIQAKFAMVDNDRFRINIGGGGNYFVYKSSRFTINALNLFPTVSFSKWNDTGISYHVVFDMLYKINKNIHIGLKSRYLEPRDYSLGIMGCIAVRI